MRVNGLCRTLAPPNAFLRAGSPRGEILKVHFEFVRFSGMDRLGDDEKVDEGELRRRNEMHVSQIMHTDVTVTSPDETLRFAAEKMDREEVGGLPVVADETLVGMVTDRDIAVRSDACGKDPMFCTVEEVMSKKVVYCHDDDDVAKAAETMRRERIRRLPVVEHGGLKLVGIVTVSDIADQVDDQLAGEIIERTARRNHRTHGVPGSGIE
jgi:CBS domain-containing protein